MLKQGKPARDTAGNWSLNRVRACVRVQQCKRLEMFW